MRSLYRRQLTMMVSIMLLSFTLLAGAFMLLSYRYIIGETRDSVIRNAGYISSFTATYYRRYLTLDVQDEFYSSYMASIAMISNSHIIVADSTGKILFSTDGRQFYAQEGQLPEDIVTQVMDENVGAYNGMTSLGGLYPERRYTSALPVTNQIGPLVVTQGMVLVAASASNLNAMWSSTATIFFFSAVVVFLISVIASTLTSAYQTRPLIEMAEAARKFGQGEFDVRVTGYEDRGDEVSALAEAFNSMANSLEKVESQRAEFIANVSHELKTPMTTIAGYADGILDGVISPEEERQYLSIISTESRRLARLVRRMLDVSQLQSMDLIKQKVPFDLSESMRRVLVNMEKKITSRGLDVDVEIPEDPVMVLGDNDLLTQVVYNLLENAAKFASQGSTLFLGLEKKGEKAVVTVRNAGQTISPEELPLLFERFHKSDRSRSEDKDGVGLGLYIVRTILEQHREKITAASEDGVTTFSFTVQLAKETGKTV